MIRVIVRNHTLKSQNEVSMSNSEAAERMERELKHGDISVRICDAITIERRYTRDKTSVTFAAFTGDQWSLTSLNEIIDSHYART